MSRRGPSGGCGRGRIFDESKREGPITPVPLPPQNPGHPAYRLRLAVDGTIEGAVVDAAGAPVAGVWLALRPAEQSPQDIPTSHPTRADELGRFAFCELPPGRYVVGVNLSLGPRRDSPYAITNAGDASGKPEVIELGLGSCVSCGRSW